MPCADIGSLKMHWSCFRNSVKGLQLDARAWTIVINGLCREGLLDEAYKSFRQMEEDDRPPDNCSYNVLIRGFLQHKDPWTVKLISEMKSQGFSAYAQATKLVHGRWWSCFQTVAWIWWSTCLGLAFDSCGL